MPSIIDGLYTAQRAFYGQQFGLEITQQNIANVNTPGYSRQRVSFIPGNPPPELANSRSGSGIDQTYVDSFRNRFLDSRLNTEIQSQGEQDAIAQALQQVEAVINDTNSGGLQSAFSSFFNSLSALSSIPEDESLRQDVLSKGQSLALEFNREAEKIQSVQMDQDRLVVDTVAQINSMTSSLAQLNKMVSQFQGTRTADESLYRDQRQQVLDQLSKLVDIAYYEAENGALTVTTKQGVLLVSDNTNQPMLAVNAGNLTQIVVDGRTITSNIESGALGGLLQVRDSVIGGYLSKLDDMAAALIQRVNQQNASGSDLNGAAGGNIFVPFVQPAPGSNQNAARSMAVALTDPKRIAAAASGTGRGNNANAVLLAGIQQETLFSGNTASRAYATLVYAVGSDLKRAQDSLETQNQVISQLQNQRDSVSGVNLDDEAVNIIRFQKAYEATARYMSVIDKLTEELVNLLR
jgi:flagellar hook-associated protein 1